MKIFISSFYLFFSISILGFSQEKAKIKIAILGTVHFGKSNDYIKVDFLDITSRKKQRELNKLLNQLALYNPTKIYVENTPNTQSFWDEIFRNYKKGLEPTNQEIINNEVYQIGIKLADKINNQFGVICINYQENEEMAFKNQEVDEAYKNYTSVLNKNKPDPGQFLEQNALANAVLQNIIDKNIAWWNLPLLDFYKNINHEKMLNDLHYVNVTAYMDQNPKGIGAELVAKEYYRNARIVQNIFKNLNPFDNQVLILIGAAHVKTLTEMLKVHPLLEVVDINKVLDK